MCLLNKGTSNPQNIYKNSLFNMEKYFFDKLRHVKYFVIFDGQKICKKKLPFKIDYNSFLITTLKDQNNIENLHETKHQ